MTKMQLHNSRSLNARVVIIWLVAVVLFLLMLSSVVNLFIKYRSIRAHIKELHDEQITLTQKKGALTSTNEYITSTEGQERVFRDKYRLVKPGEGMIVITEDAPSQPAEARKPALKRFWDSLREGLGL